METLGAGGAMVLLGFVVKFLVDLARRQNKTISNHIQHSTVANEKLAAAINRLADKIGVEEPPTP